PSIITRGYLNAKYTATARAPVRSTSSQILPAFPLRSSGWLGRASGDAPRSGGRETRGRDRRDTSLPGCASMSFVERRNVCEMSTTAYLLDVEVGVIEGDLSDGWIDIDDDLVRARLLAVFC